MTSFDAVVDAYDVGRPEYPVAVFDTLVPLEGLLVIEGGAGTGIATRALSARGAVVIAADIGMDMLRRAATRTRSLRAALADAADLPFRAACADLICFAQSWHWLDERVRCDEAARVLRDGGRWAGWWSHARADDEAWFRAHWDLVEAACPGVDRRTRDVDWGDGLRRSGRFDVRERITVPWVREVTADTWLADERSKSYVMALPTVDQTELIGALESVVRDSFPDGHMRIRYETWLWIADKL